MKRQIDFKYYMQMLKSSFGIFKGPYLMNDIVLSSDQFIIGVGGYGFISQYNWSHVVFLENNITFWGENRSNNIFSQNQHSSYYQLGAAFPSLKCDITDIGSDTPAGHMSELTMDKPVMFP